VVAVALPLLEASELFFYSIPCFAAVGYFFLQHLISSSLGGSRYALLFKPCS
jgi:hypothetical protein